MKTRFPSSKSPGSPWSVVFRLGLILLTAAGWGATQAAAAGQLLATTAKTGDTLTIANRTLPLEERRSYPVKGTIVRTDPKGTKQTIILLPDCGAVILLEPGAEIQFDDLLPLDPPDGYAIALLARVSLKRGAAQIVTQPPAATSIRFEVLAPQGFIEAERAFSLLVNAIPADGTTPAQTLVATLTGEATLWRAADRPTPYLGVLGAREQAVLSDATISVAATFSVAEFADNSPGGRNGDFVRPSNPETDSTLQTAVSQAVSVLREEAANAGTARGQSTPALPTSLNPGEAVSASFQPSGE